MKDNGRRLNFGRKYSLSVSDKQQSYFFNVEVLVRGRLNLDTGMTTDLIRLDKIILSKLKLSSKSNHSVVDHLMRVNSQINISVKKLNLKLIQLAFHEERGFGICFNSKKQINTFRTDYGNDQENNLFKIVSYFDLQGKLVKTNLYNLKEKTTEIIFSSEVG